MSSTRIVTKIHSASDKFNGQNPRETIAYLQTIIAYIKQVNASNFVSGSYEDSDRDIKIKLDKKEMDYHNFSTYRDEDNENYRNNRQRYPMPRFVYYFGREEIDNLKYLQNRYDSAILN